MNNNLDIKDTALEMMNKCINFENDGTIDREKLLHTMIEFAEIYHINKLKK